jgi:predicted enzyme related to lactoylglutathione lyase
MSTSAVGWVRGVVFSCRDHEALAGFYRDLLGLEVYKQIPGWIELRRPDHPDSVVLGFEEATADRPPGVQGSTRIDLEVEDLDAAQARLETAGATLRHVVHANPEEEHRVLADPEGNEFNIVLPFPAEW